ncbi:thiamine-phosphate synthase family protein [Thermococcus aciditolerans]|uniref:Helix-turn-helix domain-containing protein n=1 Tax=Thermococcus aciditolerans TaxID=2598455 RepID=A0A5C0SLV5_9EURY|nr:thiamine-phosphate synthase family protein [Thermococcus aciditolerans]QEK15371.1 helix-turn-helix domain-containing protein [Thermococcus aciditolerans]
MRTPSVYVAEELMPFLRAKIAERLYREGMKQSQIAEYLGITQAMVSKYLAGKYKMPPAEVAERLEDMANDVSSFILFGGSREDAILLVAKHIFDLFQTGFLCRFYSEYAGVSEDSCRSLFEVQPLRSEVLEVLNMALNELLRDEKFPSLIPEVRSNFAYSLPSPRGIEDVAAIPGRITAAKGKAFALPPEFGASGFTAGILVKLAAIRPEIRSVLNIRYGQDIESALTAAGFEVGRVKTGGLSEDEAVRVIAEAFRRDSYDAVVDVGGLGVEPLVYIFGETPFDVVEKLKRLVGNL